MHILEEICDGDRLHYELTRELLHVEKQLRMKARRAGLYKRLEEAFRKHYYTDKDDATEWALRKRDAIAAAHEGEYGQLTLFSDSDPNAPQGSNQ